MIWPILIGFALAAVLGALAVGIFSMLKGGAFDAKYGNALMRLRVALQICAVALIVLAVLFRD